MNNSNDWPHAPPHRLGAAGVYFVTAGTYQKQHAFAEQRRLDVLERGLLRVLAESGWSLEAWAVFSNHYHFVGRAPESENGGECLGEALGKLHEKTAKWVNRLDGKRGRKVWHNFRDTHLDYERSHLARLHYVHANAVHHGLVKVPSDYQWCSAAWFERVSSAAFVKTVYGFKIDRVRVADEFEPVLG